MTAATAPTGIAKYIPILGWLPKYQSGWLRFDLMAGLTAAAVVIPQAMAYASIAGLPVEVGLNPVPFATIQRAPLGATLGDERLFLNIEEAVDAYHERYDHGESTG